MQMTMAEAFKKTGRKSVICCDICGVVLKPHQVKVVHDAMLCRSCASLVDEDDLIALEDVFCDKEDDYE